MATADRRRTPSGVDLIIALALIWGFDAAVFAAIVLAFGLKEEAASPAAWLLGALLQWAWAFAVCWYFACRKYRRSFAEGFSIRRVPAAAILMGAAIGILAAALASVLVWHFSQGKGAAPETAVTPTATALFCLMMLSVPVVEEIYYRSFIYGVLERKTGPALAILIVALWFGTAHLTQTYGVWALVPFPYIMGVILTLLRHRTRSLVPSFACHWAYNATLVAGALIQFASD